MVWTRACFCCEFSSVCCDADTASLPSPSLFIAWRLLMHDWSPVSLGSGAPPDLAVFETSAGVEKKQILLPQRWKVVPQNASDPLCKPARSRASLVRTGLHARADSVFWGGGSLVAISYVLQSVHSRGCVDCMAVAFWGAGRHSVGRRSILFNLGHLTHKAWRAHPWELWSLLHWRQSARPPPLRINYICLRCPGV